MDRRARGEKRGGFAVGGKHSAGDNLGSLGKAQPNNPKQRQPGLHWFIGYG